jgi:hypothetical protein
MSTFKYFFTGTGAIKRQGIISAGKRGTSTGTQVTVLCSPMTSVTDDEVRRQVRVPVLDTPTEIKQVFLGSSALVTVRKGDFFVLGTRVFPIRSVEHWPLQNPNEHLMRLVVEVVDK